MGLVQDKKVFIFDLYGTLLDIQTDEEDQHLWAWLAMMYNDAGCDYDAAKIRENYHLLVEKKEEILARELETEYPEIELRDVFMDLLQGNLPKEEKLEKWVENVALYFRLRSRLHFRVYPDTVEALQKLKQQEKKVYLLSNAQNCFTMSELEEAELLSYFDAIYISSDYRYKKPAPEFMSCFLEKESVDPKDAVMIGNDYGADIAVASSHDMDSVFLNTDGYGKVERKKRQKRVEKRLYKAIHPYVIESGRLLEIFDL